MKKQANLTRSIIDDNACEAVKRHLCDAIDIAQDGACQNSAVNGTTFDHEFINVELRPAFRLVRNVEVSKDGPGAVAIWDALFRPRSRKANAAKKAVRPSTKQKRK